MDSTDNHNINVTDVIQERFDYSKFKFLRTVILLAAGGVLYTSIGMKNFIKIMIVYAILMCARLILAEITIVKKYSKKQYQLSGHIMLFTLFLITASHLKLFYMNNKNVFAVSILLYSLINIVTRGTNTSSVLFSLLVVYTISNLEQISEYLHPVLENPSYINNYGNTGYNYNYGGNSNYGNYNNYGNNTLI